MTMLSEWGARHGVDPEAINELRIMMGTVPGINLELAGAITSAKSEAAVQVDVRLEAAQKGVRVSRNNVGACKDADTGRLIRYGLWNDSKKMNKLIKSSDLIGLRPVMIQQHHVGMIIGQFVAREIKHEGWVFKGTEHEVAQRTFIEMVNSLGGDARFADSVGTL